VGRSGSAMEEALRWGSGPGFPREEAPGWISVSPWQERLADDATCGHPASFGTGAPPKRYPAGKRRSVHASYQLVGPRGDRSARGPVWCRPWEAPGSAAPRGRAQGRPTPVQSGPGLELRAGRLPTVRPEGSLRREESGWNVRLRLDRLVHVNEGLRQVHRSGTRYGHHVTLDHGSRDHHGAGAQRRPRRGACRIQAAEPDRRAASAPSWCSVAGPVVCTRVSPGVGRWVGRSDWDGTDAWELGRSRGLSVVSPRRLGTTVEGHGASTSARLREPCLPTPSPRRSGELDGAPHGGSRRRTRRSGSSTQPAAATSAMLGSLWWPPPARLPRSERIRPRSYRTSSSPLAGPDQRSLADGTAWCAVSRSACCRVATPARVARRGVGGGMTSRRSKRSTWAARASRAALFPSRCRRTGCGCGPIGTVSEHLESLDESCDPLPPDLVPGLELAGQVSTCHSRVLVVLRRWCVRRPMFVR